MKSPTEYHPMQRAFTLVEMAVVLVIMGLMTTFILRAQTATHPSTCYETTQAQMQEIKVAIEHFVHDNNRYPTPASRKIGVSDPSYGREASGTAIASWNDGKTTTLFGSLPFQALALPTTFAMDCWGNQFTYAVTSELTVTPGFGPLVGFPNPTTVGGLTVKTGDSTIARVLVNDAAFVIVSHGETGAQPNNGGVRKNNNSGAAGWCSSNTPLDHENCNVTDSVFFSGLFNNGDHAGADFFDDVILYAPKLVSNCNLPSNPVTWQVGTASCNGTITGPVMNGNSKTAIDVTRPTTDHAQFTCQSGALVIDQATAVCTTSTTPPPPVGCAADFTGAGACYTVNNHDGYNETLYCSDGVTAMGSNVCEDTYTNPANGSKTPQVCVTSGVGGC